MPIAFTLAALKTRLTTDPAGIGYAADVAARNDTNLETLANDKTTGGTVAREPIASSEFLLTIAADIDRMTSLQKQDLYSGWLAGGTVPVADQRFQDWWGRLATESFTSTAAVQALQTRPASDMEVAFGAGRFVGVNEISQALNP